MLLQPTKKRLPRAEREQKAIETSQTSWLRSTPVGPSKWTKLKNVRNRYSTELEFLMLDVSNGTQPAEVALNTEWQGTELAWILGVQGGSRVVNHNVVSFVIVCRFLFFFVCYVFVFLLSSIGCSICSVFKACDFLPFFQLYFSLGF